MCKKKSDHSTIKIKSTTSIIVLLKKNNSARKLHVVFDSSPNSSSRFFSKDLLMIGPGEQHDMYPILTCCITLVVQSAPMS